MNAATRTLGPLLACAICLGTLGFAAPLRAGEAPDEGLPNPFFALVNCVQCDDYATREAQAKLLKELGYEGVAPSGTAGVAEMLRVFDEHDLPMTALYVRSDLDPEKRKYDAALPEVIRMLQGRDTFLWLFILRGPFKSASPEGDRRAVAIVREVAAMCEASGVRVALYPHAGFYVERVEDAVRVAEKVDRPNVGVTFNLCHWLKVDEPSSMERLVKLAAPHLYLVTINGADRDGKSWDRLIQPLDRGTFDVGALLEALRKVGYRGPIGLQCYAVPGDKRENLKRSMEAWHKLSKRVGGE